MASKTADQKEVPVVETEKDKKVVEEKAVVEDEVKEDEDVEEVKDTDAKKENGKEVTNGDSTPAEGDKCCVKRKSTGAGDDAPEGTPTEGATPEKKAKLDEPAEAESNGKAEVAA